MGPDPHLSESAVAHRILSLAVRVLRLPPPVLPDLSDGPLGVIPERHYAPFGVPGARLFAAQNYHHVVVLKLVRAADIAEVGNVGAGEPSTAGEPRAVLLPSQSATDTPVRHHQGPLFLGYPPDPREGLYWGLALMCPRPADSGGVARESAMMSPTIPI
jgi:hypothetical protein